jgi:hypothetical protein
MRRSLLAFLLLLSFASVRQVVSQTPQAQAASQSDQLRATAQRLLATGSASDAVQAADLLDKASEIDARDAATAKAKAETQQLQQPAASGWKTLVDITPFLSFVIVALGFFFTSYQTRVADKEKRQEAIRKQQEDAEAAARQRQADEEKRWNDAFTLIQKTEDFSPSATLLGTFLNGPYATLARETAAKLLLTAKKFDNFRDLFTTFIEPVTSTNLFQVLDLLRSVSVTAAPLLYKANSAPGLTALSPTEADSYTLLVHERIFLGTKAAVVLRQPRASPTPLDFTDIGFDGSDLTGADLRGCIAPSTLNEVNLDRADLRGMTGFEDTWVYNTAWWHASQIDEAFLNLLIERSPFKEDQTFKTPLGISAEDYRVNVERLKTQAQRANKAAAA